MGAVHIEGGKASGSMLDDPGASCGLAIRACHSEGHALRDFRFEIIDGADFFKAGGGLANWNDIAQDCNDVDEADKAT